MHLGSLGSVQGVYELCLRDLGMPRPFNIPSVQGIPHLGYLRWTHARLRAFELRTRDVTTYLPLQICLSLQHAVVPSTLGYQAMPSAKESRFLRRSCVMSHGVICNCQCISSID